MQSAHFKVVNRIKGKTRGSLFVVNDFLDITSQENVKKILLRLTNQDQLQRISPGIYYFPEKSKLLNTNVSPRIDKIAEAIARKNKMRILITEPLGANLLGLTTQVPAKYVFLTDGKSKKVTIGKQQIVFKHAAPSVMGLSRSKGGIVVQALKYFGEKRVSPEIKDQLKKKLPKKVKNDLLECLGHSPVWMHQHLKEIAKED